jgi:L-ascorbate peroxidase
MASSLAAASALGAKAATFQRVSKRSAPAAQKASAVVRAQKQEDVAPAPASGVSSRRQALSAGAALVGSLASASPAFAGLFDNLELPSLPAGGDVREKRVVNLPQLVIEPIGREVRLAPHVTFLQVTKHGSTTDVTAGVMVHVM